MRAIFTDTGYKRYSSLCPTLERHKNGTAVIQTAYEISIRDLTILGRQRDGDGQNKLLQINGSKDNSSYIINRMNFIIQS
jgi:hypothetical protein